MPNDRGLRVNPPSLYFNSAELCWGLAVQIAGWLTPGCSGDAHCCCASKVGLFPYHFCCLVPPFSLLVRAMRFRRLEFESGVPPHAGLSLAPSLLLRVVPCCLLSNLGSSSTRSASRSGTVYPRFLIYVLSRVIPFLVPRHALLVLRTPTSVSRHLLLRVGAPSSVLLHLITL